MSEKITRATIALVDYSKTSGYSIVSISVDVDSVKLTGAWEYSTFDAEVFENILFNKVTLALTDS
jgi:hypothetical protein